MDLHTISRIEQYICDALIASPLIPLSVNVLRLADAVDKEMVVQQTNNIVVRYVGSSDTVKNRIPMIYERRMRFELNFSAQNYLTSSGHDFATQMLAGAFITLNGGVPSGAGVQVIEPFTCDGEQFTGLTEESQYTYSQTYVLTIEESLPYVALDPCVQRGNCRELLPGIGVETRVPLAGVVDEASGEIYVPDYTGLKAPAGDYDANFGVRWSNEATQSGNWVFICDPDEVFIEDPINQPIYLLSNRNYTEDGRLVVTVFDEQTREPLREVFYVNTGKKLARYALELWNQATNDENRSLDTSWSAGMKVGELAVIKGAYQLLYQDPLDPQAKKIAIDGGQLIGAFPEVFIQTPQGRFIFVQKSPQGKGWILQDSIEFAALNSLWKLGCPDCVGNTIPHKPC